MFKTIEKIKLNFSINQKDFPLAVNRCTAPFSRIFAPIALNSAPRVQVLSYLTKAPKNRCFYFSLTTTKRGVG